MSVVPVTQLSLSRQRKAMSDALDDHSWESIAGIDNALSSALDAAVADPEKDMKVLLSELGEILKVYKQVVLSSQAEADELIAGA